MKYLSMFYIFMYLSIQGLIAEEKVIFTDDQIMIIIDRICNKGFNCPKDTYATFTSPGRSTWKKEKIFESNLIKNYKNGLIEMSEIYPLFLKEFCCETLECFSRNCRFFQRPEEKALIKHVMKNFGANAPKLFELNLEELEEFREPVMHQIEHKTYENQKNPHYTAQVEDLFDYLHKHHDRILQRFKEVQKDESQEIQEKK
ncbi:DUF19 domain-containing protein [Caenorhabditis elegans]|uniref:DUF19 domain-containing protein n=1 Tax=Caenorhabditis elegans TaxID=6239 RepID=Q8MP14_CAEEL|nr:DUF19 domain-containing protein [Caenorhabditis elegans]CCD61813.1 DUF19 domain-containing protein [Caenorhabditis elegans]|eukprot:NP_497208.2 Uncharacterized protein CELE_T22F7.4 [Caenorhabditis elegans]